MTISTEASEVTVQGNGVTTVFSYDFLIPGSNSTDQTNVQVTYTDASGNSTILADNEYSITGINNSSGGTVTYPLTGSPIATGASLLIQRNVPYTQLVAIANMGAFYPQAVEGALDTLCMEIQQLLAQIGGVGGETETTITGTTSGNAYWSQPFTLLNFKAVMVYFAAYENGTTTAQTITFGTPFRRTPFALVNSYPVSSFTTTGITLPTSMGSSYTGWLILLGN